MQIASIVFAVILLDPAGTIREANPAAEEMLGSSAVRLFGRSFFEIVAIGDRRVADALRDTDGQMVARGLAIEIGRRERKINLTCSPIAGDPGWRIVTLSDAGQEDEDRDAERIELRAPTVLAHEIKNPLAAIRGASQLLDRRATEKDKALTQLIATEVDRIAQLVDRMQQLGSAATIVSVPCNLHEAVRNAIATVRTSRGPGVETKEEFDPSLPLVLADRGALEQILINLIANASDASEAVANAQVTVRTRFTGGLVFNAIRLGKATRLPIEVSVSDNGPGIDPALRDHVFEPFVSSKPQGQGLGLALVRKLVRDMGGRIAHERDERAGLTHFRINLPMAQSLAQKGEGK
ncbi:PAS domain-containing sensor histidine kinase [Erythrobacter sp. QSSC1-22B]|nr:PAS domain-containing sensor histidine kinase [Erythrobacter sp. QSSC1-22B]